MGKSIVEKIIASHLLRGQMTRGTEVGIRIDHTLTQDPTGIMALLQFESLGIEGVRTEKTLAFTDHNTLQTGFESADDLMSTSIR